ncbi:MAG TPA: hypothetical protein VLC95_06235, partial [Anaerolineae bacterium]|nr:hypothetical protein [Anaerolineae bacterium]
VGQYRPGQDIVVLVEPGPQDTVGSLLVGMGIPIEEISHIFVNAKLLATRNSMAAYYGYPHTGSDLSDWNLTVAVEDGDRIGLFGRDMAVLGM